MSHRREQLASSLRKTIGQVIAGGFNDPRITGMISVTSVEVSPDNRHASVSVSFFPAGKAKLSLAGLNSAAGHIRSEVGGLLRMRSVPNLHFKADGSLKREAGIYDAIRKAVGESGEAPVPTTPVEEPKP